MRKEKYYEKDVLVNVGEKETTRGCLCLRSVVIVLEVAVNEVVIMVMMILMMKIVVL